MVCSREIAFSPSTTNCGNCESPWMWWNFASIKPNSCLAKPYELESAWCCLTWSQAQKPAVTAASTPAALKTRSGHRIKAKAPSASGPPRAPVIQVPRVIADQDNRLLGVRHTLSEALLHRIFRCAISQWPRVVRVEDVELHVFILLSALHEGIGPHVVIAVEDHVGLVAIAHASLSELLKPWPLNMAFMASLYERAAAACSTAATSSATPHRHTRAPTFLRASGTRPRLPLRRTPHIPFRIPKASFTSQSTHSRHAVPFPIKHTRTSARSINGRMR